MGKQKGGSSSGSHATRARKKEAKNLRARSRQRKRTALWVSAAVVVILITGVAFSVGNQKQQALYDLSEIGQGVPAVVQVWDITCPICNDLKANVGRIRGDFEDNALLIRVADVATEEGVAFASRYTVQRRQTLLYIDESGQLVDEQIGLQEVDDLRQAFERHAAD